MSADIAQVQKINNCLLPYRGSVHDQVDAPATIMSQFKESRRHGVLDFAHTPDMVPDSRYYADDNRVEVIGDRGILLINPCTARTLDLPPLMLFRDGKTTEIPIERSG